MKMKFTLLLAIIIWTGAKAQDVFTVHDLELEIQKTDISAIDIDGDGDRDLLLIGENPNGRFAQLYQNDGDLTFTPVESPFAAAALSTVDWGDVNGDGNLDAVQSGFAADSIVANLFTSNSDGAFSVDLSNEFVHMSPSMGMADMNNDGYTDIYVFGNHFEGKPQLYFNDKEGGFTVSAQFDDYSFVDPQISEVDIDNDGDLDFFLMAGYEVGLDARFDRIFYNENGTFTETDPGILAKGFGHAEWGDYDTDGDLDLLINGDGWVNSGEDDDNIYRLYKNTSGAFTEAATFSTYRQSNVGDGSRFADWDNDGDLDIILTGWNSDAGRQATAIFNNSSGTFTEFEGNATLPGVSESAIEVSDLDDDGDLDLIIGGYSGNQFNGEESAYNKNVSLVLENPTTGTNEAPSAPANLQAVASGNNITFSWDEATDDKTAGKSLTYNLFLVSEDGYYHVYPLADTATGKLTIQAMGNVQLNKSWTIKGLPFGNYRWGVQAIDNSFAGSAFATEEFQHLEGGPLSAIKYDVKPVVYPNPSTGELHVRVTNDIRSFNLISMDGRTIRSFINKGKDEEVRINLNKGLYILKAGYTNGSSSTHKLIVQ